MRKKTKRKAKRLVIFDADGTLSDSINYSFGGTCEVFRRCGKPEPTLREYYECFQPPFTEFYRARGIDDSIPEHQIYAWYHDVARHHEAPLYPDVAPILSILGRVELRCVLAVVSAQKNSILATQLEKVSSHFDLIIGEQQDKSGEIRRIRESYGIPKDLTWYVGDFGADMRDARKGGAQGVGITRGRDTRDILVRAQAHHVIDHLVELLQIVHPL